MATIEPRLIHLLNESTSTPQLHHADLPPLHALPLPTSTERPLPRLELDAAYRSDRPSGASAYPLRLFLGDYEAAEPSPRGRSKAIKDSSDASDDAYNKKRGRNIHIKDDFVQLPQPMKRQKSAQQAPAMPPIINGLLEPPSHPALFPPIVSNAYDENDAGQIRLLNDYAAHGAVEDRARRSPEAEKSGKSRKRAAKPRRKWSEEETKHLLLGVNRHGVGKWTSILEDPDFTFNDRTAGDLKDRFRTCCPEELRGSSKSSSQAGSPRAASQEIGRRTKSGIHAENILIEDSPSPKEAGESDSTAKPRKSRAHRKKLEDLAELGIHGPFKKSHRRERRPFTEQDDREILEGLDIYGPAWTKIQRDARFNLSSRQPTDLRDRVRNKYPSIYQRIEKGTFNSKDAPRSSNVLEPSVTMSIDSSLKRSRASSKVVRSGHNNAKEDLPTWPLHVVDTSSYTQPPQTFDFGEASGPHFMGGEMDISRLLLDDSKMAQAPVRHGADYSPGSSSPPAYITEPRRDR
ncbi:telomere-associated protein 1 [Metarhizium anisopliae]